MSRLFFGGESGIWTRATIARTNTLAGCPLWPLEYLSILGAWCFTSSDLIISYDFDFLKYFYKKVWKILSPRHFWLFCTYNSTLFAFMHIWKPLFITISFPWHMKTIERITIHMVLSSISMLCQNAF